MSNVRQLFLDDLDDGSVFLVGTLEAFSGVIMDVT